MQYIVEFIGYQRLHGWKIIVTSLLHSYQLSCKGSQKLVEGGQLPVPPPPPPVSATGSFNRSRVLISELQEDKQNPTQLRDTRIYEILFSIEAVNLNNIAQRVTVTGDPNPLWHRHNTARCRNWYDHIISYVNTSPIRYNVNIALVPVIWSLKRIETYINSSKILTKKPSPKPTSSAAKPIIRVFRIIIFCYRCTQIII